MIFDVHVIGGGPAGLSVALWLGRACRTVLLSDAGFGRNAMAAAIHGFITRDGTPPARFRRLASAELAKYSIQTRRQEIVRAWIRSRTRNGKHHTGFAAESSDGRRFLSRKLVLATGVRDRLPPIPGMADWYGRGVFHCPYCDAWERRGQRLVAYGRGRAAVGLGLMLRTWSRRVWVCTGDRPLSIHQQAQLTRNGIRWVGRKIARLDGQGGRMRRIVFAGGRALLCDALFFNTGQADRGDLAWQLGCRRHPDGCVQIDERGRTGVPGLFLAGDASHEVQFVVTAAADGARAAVAINRELQDEERS